MEDEHSLEHPPLTVVEQLPTILAGNDTPDVRRRVTQFYGSVAEIFEAWIARRTSPHTQRVHPISRNQLAARVLEAPYGGRRRRSESARLHDLLRRGAQDAQPLNRRVSSVSSFYKYLGAAAADMRLPIVVPNPAHAQFIAREATDPVEETKKPRH